MDTTTTESERAEFEAWALPRGFGRSSQPTSWAWEGWQAARASGSAAPTPEPPRDDFLHGVCIALAVVKSMDAAVLWGEIVRAVGTDDILQFAAFIEPEEWELAGFAKYAMGELRRAKPRTRRAALGSPVTRPEPDSVDSVESGGERPAAAGEGACPFDACPHPVTCQRGECKASE